jgi:4-hydroxybenzoate polyprenyltransferase
LATGAIASLAGGSPAVGVRLGIAMVGLQASIGSLNDLLDAPLDAGRKPGKPIPRGAAGRRDAMILVLAGLGVGLGLSAPSGVGCVAAALVGVGCGYAYDLRLSRGPWSWLPLAVALPIVPIYAWLGATGTIPAALGALVPVGVLAGAGLSIANGLADLERDASAGNATVAVRLGRSPAWAVHAVLLVAAIALAIAYLPRSIQSTSSIPAGLPVLGLAVGAALVAIGILLGRGGGPGRRERAWEIEAAGIAVLGGSWIAAVIGG